MAAVEEAFLWITKWEVCDQLTPNVDVILMRGCQHETGDLGDAGAD